MNVLIYGQLKSFVNIVIRSKNIERINDLISNYGLSKCVFKTALYDEIHVVYLRLTNYSGQGSVISLCDVGPSIWVHESHHNKVIETHNYQSITNYQLSLYHSIMVVFGDGSTSLDSAIENMMKQLFPKDSILPGQEFINDSSCVFYKSLIVHIRKLVETETFRQKRPHSRRLEQIHNYVYHIVQNAFNADIPYSRLSSMNYEVVQRIL